MAYRDVQAPQDQAFLDAMLGLPPEEETPAYEPQRFQGGNRFLEAFSGAQPLPYAPKGFGQGFASSVLGALSGEGQRREAERTKFDSLQEMRRREVDAERRQSKQKREEQRFTATQDIAKAGRTATEKKAEYERDNPAVTPEMIAANPSLARVPPGTRIPKATAYAAPPKAGKTLAQIRAEHKAAAEGTAAGAGDTVPGLSEEAMNGAADQYAVMGNAAIPPGGRGKERQAFVTKIVNRAYQRHPGGNFADIQSGFAADKGSLKKIQGEVDTQSAFIKTLDRNAAMVETTLKGLPDTGTTFGNALLRGGLRSLGSTQVADFNTALGVMRPEAARILQSGLGPGGGTLTKEAQEELRSIAGNDFTKKQLRGVIRILKLDSQNKQRSGNDQIGEIKARMKAAGNQGPPGTGPQATHRFDPATGSVVPIGP